MLLGPQTTGSEFRFSPNHLPQLFEYLKRIENLYAPFLINAFVHEMPAEHIPTVLKITSALGSQKTVLKIACNEDGGEFVRGILRRHEDVSTCHYEIHSRYRFTEFDADGFSGTILPDLQENVVVRLNLNTRLWRNASGDNVRKLKKWVARNEALRQMYFELSWEDIQ
eukprot:TRINITY_DN3777_c0_g1_i1.p1 TRINITY_DN3777_c0_g1~~TRINITY_DN3777_c0_g1_i1.p1  ORF type:complete len:168 (-),score=8.92 TRINITY_DN3777_c0_g1_i1:216-719(-)